MSIAALALCGGFATAQQPAEAPAEADSPARDAELERVREKLTDLLISEEIERIDYEAETYEQGMNHVGLTVQTILDQTVAGSRNIELLGQHAAQVIEALDSHKPVGLTTTFGKGVKRLPIVSRGDSRMLGELVGTTVNLIREQLGETSVTYRQVAINLFRSVLLEVEGDPFLVQYLEGIQRIAELPPSKRSRYFN
jgi:hypothetical protein